MPNRRHPRLQQLPGSVLGASTLVACQLAGDAIIHATAWPVPGAVLGMLLLWGLLCLLGRVPSGLGLVAGTLLSHLMLPLIPLVAGIGVHGALLRQHGLALLLLCAGAAQLNVSLLLRPDRTPDGGERLQPLHNVDRAAEKMSTRLTI